MQPDTSQSPSAALPHTSPIESAPAGATARKLMAAFCGLLLLGGGGAFAVANFQSNAQVVYPKLVQHEIPSLAMGGTLPSLLADPDYRLYRSDRLRDSDTAESLLERLGVSDPAAAAFLRRDPLAHQNLWGRHGRFVTVEVNGLYELEKLTARWVSDDSGKFNRLVVSRSDDGTSFSAEVQQGDLQRSTRLASGVIESSLFAATDAANLPDPVAVQLAEIFSTEVNFHRDLRKGDTFTVVYETLEADGEPLRSGRVLSAEFVNKGQVHQALWFQENENDKGAYYALDGSNLRRAFLASPLEFSRVSSNFGRRFHPIRKTWRNHNGIDYAARTGTPVRTIGDGVVQKSGWSNSYGNVVYIDHGEGRVTVYAHMSRRDVKTGERVSQGQQIGAVGSTGMSTGPHLHFELRVNGQFKDPRTIAQQSAAASPVSKAVRERFDALAQSTRIMFEQAPLMVQASAE
ncbi:M23 family metallopeptidase [Lampropedia cohaerens]|uniref:M23 family metallopeptidase n=1 Tax=Lampropedia cohaerens TaxID=1610491 RepID=UPI00069C12BA|nr:M23 family metallopeptidase [Lampropedia cohaerens]